MATHRCTTTEEKDVKDFEEDSWCLQRPKNKTILGTWEDAAFQLSLQCRDRPEDPLTVPLFSDVLPYYSLPHCGVYSPDDYHVAVPMAVILLPSEGIVLQSTLFSALPSDLQYYLQQKPVQDPYLLDVAVLVHSRPLFECTVDPSVSEVNLMFHMWAFQGIEFAEGREAHLTMEMGVFGPQGVCETRQNICEELNGVAVGRMGPRILYMHQMCLSPHNAQLATTANLSAFFAVGRQDNGRTVITYHILPNTDEMEAEFRSRIKPSRTLGGLLKNLEDTNIQTISLLAQYLKCLFIACS